MRINVSITIAVTLTSNEKYTSSKIKYADGCSNQNGLTQNIRGQNNYSAQLLTYKRVHNFNYGHQLYRKKAKSSKAVK